MFRIEFCDDPREALRHAEAFLRSRPAQCNLVLSLLENRITVPEPGNYWIVRNGEAVVGMVFQSPLDYFASVTPLPREAALLASDAIYEQGIVLPGVSGEPATVVAFAGQWAERSSAVVRPDHCGRIYTYRPEAAEEPAPVEGNARWATLEDLDLLTEWIVEFRAHGNSTNSDPRPILQRHIENQRALVWDYFGLRSWASFTIAGGEVARIGPVYTPEEFRRRGYAGACVRSLTRRLFERGLSCHLYTDLHNPTSNRVYRRIGYRACAEFLLVKFSSPVSDHKPEAPSR